VIVCARRNTGSRVARREGERQTAAMLQWSRMGGRRGCGRVRRGRLARWSGGEGGWPRESDRIQTHGSRLHTHTHARAHTHTNSRNNNTLSERARWAGRERGKKKKYKNIIYYYCTRVVCVYITIWRVPTYILYTRSIFETKKEKKNC